MKENLKELIIVVFGVMLLYLLFELSQNGRYQIIGDKYLLDTRNGQTYQDIRIKILGPGTKGPYYKWEEFHTSVK